jgi:hypothetical protein
MTLSAISRRLAASSFLRRPPTRPSARAAARPAEVGTSQIVLGTDSPFPWTRTAVDHILDTPGFSDEERIAMLGKTAAGLLEINS